MIKKLSITKKVSVSISTSKFVWKLIMQRKHCHNIYLTSKKGSHYQVVHFVIIFLANNADKDLELLVHRKREILGLCLFPRCLLQTRKLRPGEGKWPLRVFHPGSGPTDLVLYSTTADHAAHPTASLAGGHNPFCACFSLHISDRVTLCFYKHITHSLLK